MAMIPLSVVSEWFDLRIQYTIFCMPVKRNRFAP